MATIENLHPSILTLSPNEQLELILLRRTNRRIRKPNKTKPRPAKKTKTKTKTIKATPKDLISMMSKEQKLAILKQLQGL